LRFAEGSQPPARRGRRRGDRHPRWLGVRCRINWPSSDREPTPRADRLGHELWRWRRTRPPPVTVGEGGVCRKLDWSCHAVWLFTSLPDWRRQRARSHGGWRTKPRHRPGGIAARSL